MLGMQQPDKALLTGDWFFSTVFRSSFRLYLSAVHQLILCGSCVCVWGGGCVCQLSQEVVQLGKRSPSFGFCFYNWIQLHPEKRISLFEASVLFCVRGSLGFGFVLFCFVLFCLGQALAMLPTLVLNSRAKGILPRAAETPGFATVKRG